MSATRSTRSSMSNLSSKTSSPAKGSASDSKSIEDEKSVDTKGRRCSSRLGKVSESESVPEEAGSRNSSRAAKTNNVKAEENVADSSSAPKATRSRSGQSAAEAEENVASTSRVPKATRSKSGQISDTESIESSSSISTRRSTRLRKADESEDSSKNAVPTSKRSSSRLSQVSGMGSTEDLTIADKASTTTGRRSGRRLSESMGSSEDLTVADKGSTYTGRRSSRRLSDVSESTEDLTAADKASTFTGRRSSRRLSEVSESTEDLTAADKVSTHTGRRSSSRLSQVSDTGSTEDLTAADKGSLYTGRRSSSRLSQVSDTESTEDLTVTDKGSPYVGRRSSKRFSQVSGMGSTEDLTVSKKVNDNTRVAKRLPKIDECVNAEENNPDVIVTEKMKDDVLGIKSTPQSKRVSSPLSKDTVSEDTIKVLDEALTPRRSSTRLRKESETANYQEKSVDDIRGKRDLGFSSMSDAKENEKNSGNRVSAEIIRATANKSPIIGDTLETESNSSDLESTKQGGSVNKLSSDTNSTEKTSTEEKNSETQESQSPCGSQDTAKLNTSHHNDMTSLPVVKLVDCQKANVSNGDLSSSITLGTNDSPKVSSENDPCSLVLLIPYSPGESDDNKMEHFQEHDLDKQSAITEKMEKESESFCASESKLSGDVSSARDLAAFLSEMPSSDASCAYSKTSENLSRKSPRHQIKPEEAESKLNEETESSNNIRTSPRKKSGESSKYGGNENTADSFAKVQNITPEKTPKNSVHSITKDSVVESDREDLKLLNCVEPSETLASGTNKNDESPSKESKRSKKRVSTEELKKALAVMQSSMEQKLNEIAKERKRKLDTLVEKEKEVEGGPESEENDGSESSVPELINLNYSDEDSNDDVTVVNDDDDDDNTASKSNADDSKIKGLKKDNAAESDVLVEKKVVGKSPSRINRKSSEVLNVEVVGRNDSERTKEDDRQTIKPSDDTKAENDDESVTSIDAIAESDDESIKSVDVIPESDDASIKSDDVIAESDEANAESDDANAESDDVNAERDDVIPESDDENAGNDGEAESDDKGAENDEADGSGSVYGDDQSKTEASVKSDKAQDISAGGNDKTKKHVTFGGENVKPIGKSSNKATLPNLSDPEYVLKISDYINNVLDSRQKLKEISKFSNITNHNNSAKKNKTSGRPESKPNLAKISVKSDESKPTKPLPGKLSESIPRKIGIETKTLAKSKPNPANTSDKLKKSENKKNSSVTDGKLSESVTKKFKIDTNTLKNGKPNPANISDKPEVSKNKKKSSISDGKLSESVTKKCEMVTNTLKNVQPNPANISDKPEASKNKKKLTSTDAKLSESVSKTREVNIEKKSEKDQKESGETKQKACHGLVGSSNRAGRLPSTSNKQNTHTASDQTSVEEKRVEKTLTQLSDKKLSLKRKFEEKEPSAELFVHRKSKKSKKKKNRHNPKYQVLETPVDKAASKMEFNVSGKDAVNTEISKGHLGIFDKNRKSAFSGEPNTTESKELKGSKKNVVHTNWGKISVASPKSLASISGNKTTDPANKWNIKPTSADNLYKAKDVTAAKKSKTFKTSEAFTVTPSASKIVSSLVIDSQFKGVPKSCKTEIPGKSSFDSKISQFPKESQQTQQSAGKMLKQDSKLKSYPDVSNIGKKKKKRKNKKKSALFKENSSSANLMGDLVSKYLDKSKQADALKKPFVNITDFAATPDPKMLENSDPDAKVVEKKNNFSSVNNRPKNLNSETIRKLGIQDVFCKNKIQKGSGGVSSASDNVIPFPLLSDKNRFVNDKANRKRNLPEIGVKTTIPTKKPNLEEPKQVEGTNSECLATVKKMKALPDDFLEILTDQVQQNSLKGSNVNPPSQEKSIKKKKNRKRRKNKHGPQILNGGGKSDDCLQHDFIPLSGGQARFKVAVADKPLSPKSSNKHFKNQHLQRKSLKREPVQNLLAYNRKQRMLSNPKSFFEKAHAANYTYTS